MKTPHDLVDCALRGGRSDRVPFTMYECMIPQCDTERVLRNRGMCIVNRMSVFHTHRPHVLTRQHTWWEGRRRFTRTEHETPVGTLSSFVEDGGFTTWRHELLLKSPEDYAAIRYFLKDERYEPDYAEFDRAQRAGADDSICRSSFGLEPLQELISGNVMSMEHFCEEWMERRDEVLSLYEILVENRRKIYSIVAESPAGHVNYGGNVTPEIIGPKVFEKYYLPHYHEAAEVMHRHGKLIGCHFDANNRIIADAIARTPLDYIEAFTPAPDTDMTLAEARAAWPDKVLWINFPSSVHLKSDEVVAQTACDLMDEAGRLEGMLVGITEDMPPERWEQSCLAIMDGLDRHARHHPSLYS